MYWNAFLFYWCVSLVTNLIEGSFCVTRERTQPWPMLYLWWQEHCGWCVLPPYWSLDWGNGTHWWNETHNQLLLPRCRSESHAFFQVTRDCLNDYALIFLFCQYTRLVHIHAVNVHTGRPNKDWANVEITFGNICITQLKEDSKGQDIKTFVFLNGAYDVFQFLLITRTEND